MSTARNNNKAQCPLCNSIADLFAEIDSRTYYKCSTCRGVFLDKRNYLNKTGEMQRYMEHNNDVSDVRYRNFVSPITDSVLKNFSKVDKGLDYGGGTGPVIAEVLKEKEYDISVYDPYFHYFPELLAQKYNYIACCEVIEHFYYPYFEFAELKKIIEPNGMLICMTDLYYDEIDFDVWNYKDDPTHVFFYSKYSFDFIKKSIGFKKVVINGRLIEFYL